MISGRSPGRGQYRDPRHSCRLHFQIHTLAECMCNPHSKTGPFTATHGWHRAVGTLGCPAGTLSRPLAPGRDLAGLCSLASSSCSDHRAQSCPPSSGCSVVPTFVPVRVFAVEDARSVVPKHRRVSLRARRPRCQKDGLGPGGRQVPLATCSVLATSSVC